ncbi:unannotated protein [freshwater metagenome]|uniref:Unannotated protein n=1 Tax=freshwater metagenome TaxID=449393 RepID=A0A6J6WZM8_9ZZZZ
MTRPWATAFPKPVEIFAYLPRVVIHPNTGTAALAAFPSPIATPRFSSGSHLLSTSACCPGSLIVTGTVVPSNIERA